MRLRALEPGRYILTGYRIERRDDSGKEWFISAILPKAGRPIEVKSGRVVSLDLPSRINVLSSGKLVDGRGFAVRAGFQGINHAGMSIYLEGRRIPLRYKITKADGKELESGGLDYG